MAEKMGSKREIGRLPTGEGTIRYRVNHGAGPNLLLIPGSFNDHRALTKLVRHLDSSLNLVMVELRGHGGSWPPPSNGSIEQFAGDVVAVADRLGLKRFFVGGHSIGGMVAPEVGRVASDRAIGIVSIEGWTRAEAQRDAFGVGGVQNLPPEVEERRRSIRSSVTRKWTEEQVHEFARIWRRWDGYSFLESTEIPILELWGDRGGPPPSRDKLHIPDRPNIEVVWLENASHCLTLERPREVAILINDFVSRVCESL